jgi:hypothetical protein
MVKLQVGLVEGMASGRARVEYGLAGAGIITLIVAFIRTAILSTDTWLIIILWAGGAIMLLAALMLARLGKDSKAQTASPSV